MADSARPRPRPRPRPVAKASSSSNVGAGTNTAEASSSGTSSTAIPLLTSSNANNTTRRQRAPIVLDVQDNDEMFMRNRNRSSKAWQKLEEINKEVVKVDEDSSGSDADSTPRKGKYKRAKKEGTGVPAWQRKDFAKLLSQDLSDDSDDGIEVTGESNTPNGKHKGKRKRPRSRSRSITPPPDLPAHQIQNAKNVVRATLRGAVRPPSPTTIEVDDDSSSNENLDLQPEFRLLAQRVRDQPHRASSQAPDGVGDEIQITVQWQPHPLDTQGKQENWEYKINRSDNFRDLFEAVAEDASVPVPNLILTHNNIRIFSSVTPQTLKIWSDTAELCAYNKTAYDYIQKTAHNPPPSQPSTSKAFANDGPINLASDDEDDGNAPSPPTQTQTQESDAESEVEGDKFKLILRSSGNKDITLTVRNTTKCGAIVKAFLRKLGLENQYPEVFEDAVPISTGKKGKGKKAKGNAGSGKDPRLCIDGEKMENKMEIGGQDLDDGDMIEVVGL